MFMRITS